MKKTIEEKDLIYYNGTNKNDSVIRTEIDNRKITVWLRKMKYGDRVMIYTAYLPTFMKKFSSKQDTEDFINDFGIYEMKEDNTIISSRFAMYVVPTKYILVKCN